MTNPLSGDVANAYAASFDGELAEPSRPWTCGKRGCLNPRSWHARRIAYLEQTEGPRAGHDFEADHVDPESSDWSFDADDEPSPVQRMLDDYRRAIVAVTRAFDAWSPTRPGSQEAATLEAELRKAWNVADDVSDRLLAAFAEADL